LFFYISSFIRDTFTITGGAIEANGVATRKSAQLKELVGPLKFVGGTLLQQAAATKGKAGRNAGEVEKLNKVMQYSFTPFRHNCRFTPSFH